MGRGNTEARVKGTPWTAYNGVAEYVDYRRFETKRDRHVEAMWFGEGYSIKARAYTVAEMKLAAWTS
jgi:hypothetical protein